MLEKERNRRMTRLRLLAAATVAVLLAWAAPAAAQTPSCAPTDAAITATIQRLNLTVNLPLDTDTTNLVADCTTLLRLKDELRGAGNLNWDTTIHMWSGYTGIEILGRHHRVRELGSSDRAPAPEQEPGRRYPGDLG